MITPPCLTASLIEFPFVGRVGASGFQFVYVLKLADGKWYVGSTADPVRRVAQHCARIGAVATRQSAPVALVALYRFRDCYYIGQPARERVEMHVAAKVAAKFGERRVQGARHGSGMRLKPLKRGERTIRKNEKFMRSDMGRRLLATVERLAPDMYGPLIERHLADHGLGPLDCPLGVNLLGEGTR